MTFTATSQPLLESINGLEQMRRSQVKQEVRQGIQELLHFAQDSSPAQCIAEIRAGLLTIQHYCSRLEKAFIFIEEVISCDQYELGGCAQDSATLFRGPNEDASVAICVTQKGSLLHRSSSPWRIYKNAGDISLVEESVSALLVS